MSRPIDEEARLAEVRADLRAAQRRERELFTKLGGAVAAKEDPAPIHAELRQVRERTEGLVAATMLLDID